MNRSDFITYLNQPHMEGAIWLLIMAVGFLIAEAFLPTFGVLGVIGGISLLLSVCLMFEYIPGLIIDPGLIGGVALCGTVFALLALYVTKKVYNRKVSTGYEGLIGSPAKIIDWHNKKGRVAVQGEIWLAESDHALELKKDETVIIESIDQLTLRIKKD